MSIILEECERSCVDESDRSGERVLRRINNQQQPCTRRSMCSLKTVVAPIKPHEPNQGNIVE